ncbi:MAG: hypothetical protein NTV23_03880 [Propionibacteriales bacterium]|nr:hypothetical protein [Propionibacteriales bacterium]
MSLTAYDEFVRTDGDELWDRLHQAHRRFAALLSVTPAKHPVPGSDWTAGAIAAHLLTVVQRYTQRDMTSAAGLSPDAAAISALNETELTRYADASVAEVLDLLWQELADLEQKFPRDADLHQTFPFHADQQVDVAGWLGNLIGEFLVHGRDVARSRGKTWLIGSRNAALALNLGIQAIPGFVSPDAPGDLKLEIRTPQTTPWVIDLADGVATSRAARNREPADVKVYVRTEPLLLNQYGRIGMPMMTVLGAVVIGGRRPWRLTRLGPSFQAP